VIEDITYRNIELRGARRAFELDLSWNMRIAIPESARMPPTMRNIRIINVHGTAKSAGIIHGLPDSLIDGVTFEHCAVTADTGLVIENAKNIDTSGLALTVKTGEAIVRR
jgi:hypothetical protein